MSVLWRLRKRMFSSYTINNRIDHCRIHKIAHNICQSPLHITADVWYTLTPWWQVVVRHFKTTLTTYHLCIANLCKQWELKHNCRFYVSGVLLFFIFNVCYHCTLCVFQHIQAIPIFSLARKTKKTSPLRTQSSGHGNRTPHPTDMKNNNDNENG